MRTASRDTEKSITNNYIVSNQKFLTRNKIHSIALELKHAINHYDVRRGMCATSLSVKEKRSFVKNSQVIKSNLESRQFRYMHKINHCRTKVTDCRNYTYRKFSSISRIFFTKNLPKKSGATYKEFCIISTDRIWGCDLYMLATCT